jgi:ribose/xylose/arabinose/galactoside ABC-type transport system permease subunit
MTQSRPGPTRRAPRLLWVVGIIALLWNAIGAFDYLMTQTRNPSYMSAFPPEQLAWFYGLPAWVVAAWATAVWGGVLGSVLLLLRKRLAVPVFLVSLVAMVITTFQNWVLANAAEIFPDTFSRVFSVLIFAIAVGLFFYARAMSKRGVLV